MRRYSTVAVLVAVTSLAGCGSNNSDPKAATNGTRRPSVMEQLSASKLPAMRSIEKWDNAYGEGLSIATDHYRIYTTLTDTLMLRLLPAFLESAYEGYETELPERIETSNRFEVYLFAERQQWEDFTDHFAGADAGLYKQIQKGAYCDKGTCVAYNIGRNETYSALGHEGWHQFSGRHFYYRLPSWLDEGIATLFETNTYEDGTWKFETQSNAGRLGGLKRTMLSGHFIPLEQLVALNPGEVIGGQDSTMAFYSESYSLVRFLREEKYGQRLSRYHAMLLGGLRGDWPLAPEYQRIAADRNVRLTVRWNAYVGPMLFEHYISSDWGQIEAEYVSFCRKITYRVTLRQEVVPVNDYEVH
jgi:hypothetical protein